MGTVWRMGFERTALLRNLGAVGHTLPVNLQTNFVRVLSAHRIIDSAAAQNVHTLADLTAPEQLSSRVTETKLHQAIEQFNLMYLDAQQRLSFDAVTADLDTPVFSRFFNFVGRVYLRQPDVSAVAAQETRNAQQTSDANQRLANALQVATIIALNRTGQSPTSLLEKYYDPNARGCPQEVRALFGEQQMTPDNPNFGGVLSDQNVYFQALSTSTNGLTSAMDNLTRRPQNISASEQRIYDILHGLINSRPEANFNEVLDLMAEEAFYGLLPFRGGFLNLIQSLRTMVNANQASCQITPNEAERARVQQFVASHSAKFRFDETTNNLVAQGVVTPTESEALENCFSTENNRQSIRGLYRDSQTNQGNLIRATQDSLLRLSSILSLAPRINLFLISLASSALGISALYWGYRLSQVVRWYSDWGSAVASLLLFTAETHYLSMGALTNTAVIHSQLATRGAAGHSWVQALREGLELNPDERARYCLHLSLNCEPPEATIWNILSQIVAARFHSRRSSVQVSDNSALIYPRFGVEAAVALARKKWARMEIVQQMAERRGIAHLSANYFAIALAAGQNEVIDEDSVFWAIDRLQEHARRFNVPEKKVKKFGRRLAEEFVRRNKIANNPYYVQPIDKLWIYDQLRALGINEVAAENIATLVLSTLDAMVADARLTLLGNKIFSGQKLTDEEQEMFVAAARRHGILADEAVQLLNEVQEQAPEIEAVVASVMSETASGWTVTGEFDYRQRVEGYQAYDLMAGSLYRLFINEQEFGGIPMPTAERYALFCQHAMLSSPGVAGSLDVSQRKNKAHIFDLAENIGRQLAEAIGGLANLADMQRDLLAERGLGRTATAEEIRKAREDALTKKEEEMEQVIRGILNRYSFLTEVQKDQIVSAIFSSFRETTLHWQICAEEVFQKVARRAEWLRQELQGKSEPEKAKIMNDFVASILGGPFGAADQTGVNVMINNVLQKWAFKGGRMAGINLAAATKVIEVTLGECGDITGPAGREKFIHLLQARLGFTPNNAQAFADMLIEEYRQTIASFKKAVELVINGINTVIRKIEPSQVTDGRAQVGNVFISLDTLRQQVAEAVIFEDVNYQGAGKPGTSVMAQMGDTAPKVLAEVGGRWSIQQMTEEGIFGLRRAPADIVTMIDGFVNSFRRDFENDRVPRMAPHYRDPRDIASFFIGEISRGVSPQECVQHFLDRAGIPREEINPSRITQLEEVAGRIQRRVGLGRLVEALCQNRDLDVENFVRTDPVCRQVPNVEITLPEVEAVYSAWGVVPQTRTVLQNPLIEEGRKLQSHIIRGVIQVVHSGGRFTLRLHPEAAQTHREEEEVLAQSFRNETQNFSSFPVISAQRLRAILGLSANDPIPDRVLDLFEIPTRALLVPKQNWRAILSGLNNLLSPRQINNLNAVFAVGPKVAPELLKELAEVTIIYETNDQGKPVEVREPLFATRFSAGSGYDTNFPQSQESQELQQRFAERAMSLALQGLETQEITKIILREFPELAQRFSGNFSANQFSPRADKEKASALEKAVAQAVSRVKQSLFRQGLITRLSEDLHRNLSAGQTLARNHYQGVIDDSVVSFSGVCHLTDQEADDCKKIAATLAGVFETMRTRKIGGTLSVDFAAGSADILNISLTGAQFSEQEVTAARQDIQNFFNWVIFEEPQNARQIAEARIVQGQVDQHLLKPMEVPSGGGGVQARIAFGEEFWRLAEDVDQIFSEILDGKVPLVENADPAKRVTLKQRARQLGAEASCEISVSGVPESDLRLLERHNLYSFANPHQLTVSVELTEEELESLLNPANSAHPDPTTFIQSPEIRTRLLELFDLSRAKARLITSQLIPEIFAAMARRKDALKASGVPGNTLYDHNYFNEKAPLAPMWKFLAGVGAQDADYRSPAHAFIDPAAHIMEHPGLAHFSYRQAGRNAREKGVPEAADSTQNSYFGFYTTIENSLNDGDGINDVGVYASAGSGPTYSPEAFQRCARLYTQSLQEPLPKVETWWEKTKNNILSQQIRPDGTRGGDEITKLNSALLVTGDVFFGITGKFWGLGRKVLQGVDGVTNWVGMEPIFFPGKLKTEILTKNVLSPAEFIQIYGPFNTLTESEDYGTVALLEKIMGLGDSGSKLFGSVIDEGRMSLGSVQENILVNNVTSFMRWPRGNLDVMLTEVWHTRMGPYRKWRYWGCGQHWMTGFFRPVLNFIPLAFMASGREAIIMGQHPQFFAGLAGATFALNMASFLAAMDDRGYSPLSPETRGCIYHDWVGLGKMATAAYEGVILRERPAFQQSPKKFVVSEVALPFRQLAFEYITNWANGGFTAYSLGFAAASGGSALMLLAGAWSGWHFVNGRLALNKMNKGVYLTRPYSLIDLKSWKRGFGIPGWFFKYAPNYNSDIPERIAAVQEQARFLNEFGQP